MPSMVAPCTHLASLSGSEDAQGCCDSRWTELSMGGEHKASTLAWRSTHIKRCSWQNALKQVMALNAFWLSLYRNCGVAWTGGISFLRRWKLRFTEEKWVGQVHSTGTNLCSSQPTSKYWTRMWIVWRLIQIPLRGIKLSQHLGKQFGKSKILMSFDKVCLFQEFVVQTYPCIKMIHVYAIHSTTVCIRKNWKQSKDPLIRNI